MAPVILTSQSSPPSSEPGTTTTPPRRFNFNDFPEPANSTYDLLVLGLLLFTVTMLIISFTFVGRPHPVDGQKSCPDRSFFRNKLESVSKSQRLKDWIASKMSSSNDNNNNATTSTSRPTRFCAYGTFSQFICVICLDTIQPAQQIHALKCDHVFHASCLERWFVAVSGKCYCGHGWSWKCPICNRKVLEDNAVEPNGPSIIMV